MNNSPDELYNTNIVVRGHSERRKYSRVGVGINLTQILYQQESIYRYNKGRGVNDVGIIILGSIIAICAILQLILFRYRDKERVDRILFALFIIEMVSGITVLIFASMHTIKELLL